VTNLLSRVFKMRVTSDWLAELDAWRAKHDPKWSRGKAVREAMLAVFRGNKGEG
jgi:hypothetical protein